MAMWNTYIWVDSADETAVKVRDAGGSVVMEPFDVMDAGRMAVFTDPEGAAVLRLAGEGAQGRADRQRARFGELQRPQHPRRGRREVVLRLGVRLADARRWAAVCRCGRCRATATTSSATTPTSASRWREVGAPAGFEDVVATINPIPADQPDTPPHWSVTFAVDDADATPRRQASSAAR